MLPSHQAERSGKNNFADRTKASTRSLRGLQDFSLYGFDLPWGKITCGNKSFEAITMEAIPEYTLYGYTLYFKDELGDELARVALPLDALRGRLTDCNVQGVVEHHNAMELLKLDVNSQMRASSVHLPERLLHELCRGLERYAANASMVRASVGGIGR